MAKLNTEPVENPNATDKDEDMTVANGKGQQCKFVAIQNYENLYSSLLLASSTYKSESALKNLYNLTEKLYNSALNTWDMLMEKPDETLKALGNAEVTEINFKNLISNESVEEYVPVCPVLRGTAEAIAIINDWKTRVRDIQSRLRVRVNSLSINAPKITETEQNNSNAFNNILFFITNDPSYHGDILKKNCQECEDTATMRQSLNRLKEMLDTFTDADDYNKIHTKYGYSYTKINNLQKWRSVVGMCMMILDNRDSSRKEANNG